MADHPTKQWADPDSILGMLQRGRGRGWLLATSDLPRGRDRLLQTLSTDPCWDHQVESRTEYYATLATALGLSAFDLFDAVSPVDDFAHRLLLSVLFELGCRGDVSAVDRLKQQLAVTERRDAILWGLFRLGSPELLDGVPELLDTHCTDDELVHLVRHSGRDAPWAAWAAANPRIASACEQSRPAVDRPRVAQRPAQDAPVEALLAHKWPGVFPKQVVHRLAGRLKPAELELVYAAARGPAGTPRDLALVALGRRRDPAALEAVIDAFTRNVTGRERLFALGYVQALDPSLTLPLARQWIVLDDDRVSIAAHLFECHATKDDLPLVAQALERSWLTRRMYDLCNLIDAVGLHPDTEPPAVLREVFEQVEYSYARRLTAHVLASGDPEFPDRYGTECLWDCEATTRRIGAANAPASGVATRTRIQLLANDDYEDNIVRAAAQQRLLALSPGDMGR